MTIILGVLNDKCAVVASDSIKVSPQKQIDYNFNKTFEFADPPIVGAYAGLLKFNGLYVPDHIQNAIYKHQIASWKDLLKSVENEITANLSQVKPSTAKFPRTVELILAGKKNFTEGPFEIFTIDFAESEDKKSILSKSHSYKGKGACAYGGDDKAQAAVEKRLVKKKGAIGKLRAPKLIKLAIGSIERGINNCGPHETFPDIQSCGGESQYKILR